MFKVLALSIVWIAVTWLAAHGWVSDGVAVLLYLGGFVAIFATPR